mgnify:CR=1 FL=1
MPVAVAHSPFNGEPPPTKLLTPEARVLLALMPADPASPQCEWPALTRAALGRAVGYSGASGTVTRAINGGRNMPTGPRLPGLLARGLVEVMVLDIDGVTESSYRITATGAAACLAHGRLPKVRDADKSTNTARKKKVEKSADGG